MLARAHLLRAERSQAAIALARSLELIHQQRWMAFLSWPQALQAELTLQTGDIAGAAYQFEQAWVLACQVQDPCWEAMAARGLGLVHAGRGEHVTAAEWLDEAVMRCTRVTDRYQWIHAYVLDAAIITALDHGDHDRARSLVARLAPLAARCDLRELVVHAHLHQWRLGDRTTLPTARLLSAHIDNPALTESLDGTSR